MSLSAALLASLLLVVVAVTGPASAQPPPPPLRPHVLYMLVDDWGWANVPWHLPNRSDIQAPTMLSLLSQGIELDRHYVFKYCSPTRSAVQSGRNPIHVNVQNLDPTFVNPQDPLSGYAGISLNMTTIAEVMVKGGYRTYMAGKWDCGMATPAHTPRGRGYNTSLFYFHHANDYWQQTTADAACKPSFHDLWHHNETDAGRPAFAYANNNTCRGSPFPTNYTGQCVYEDEIFTNEVINRINLHPADVPMFLFWAPHSVHAPLEVPPQFYEQFSMINDTRRRTYQAMVAFIDSMLGKVVQTLQAKGMWDNTLVIIHADNGGPVYYNGSAGANNYPLRGSKGANFEGGVRVNALVSGGAIPPAQRGTIRTGLICGWDWYATLAYLAGVDPTDHAAAAAGLPAVDGINVWNYLIGETPNSPRKAIPLGGSTGHHDTWGNPGSKTLVEGLIVDDEQGHLWKILVGDIDMNGWQGPYFPNSSSSAIDQNWANCESGCLFDLAADPNEHVDLAKSNPDQLQQMLTLLRQYNATVFSPHRGKTADSEACQVARDNFHGYYGPWLQIPPTVPRSPPFADSGLQA